MIIKKIPLYLMSFLALVLFGYTNSVYAMTVSPVRYEVQGNPGETITKEVTIINEDKADVTYYTSYANFEAQGETGSASFVEPKDDIGTWMTIDPKVNLLAGEQKTLKFSIKIPENAEPGGHFGVIFFGTSSENNAESKQLSVSAKTGLLVMLSVSGNVKEGGGLLDFITKDNQFWYNSLPVSFVYRFKNDGGDRIKPAGFIKISNTVFIPTKKINANPVNGNILPSSTRKFTVDWINHLEVKADPSVKVNFFKKFIDKSVYQFRNFAVGLYSAKLDIGYGTQNERAMKTVFFFVFPWQLLICLIIIFTIIFFISRTLIRRYNRYIIKMARVGMNTPYDAHHG